MNNHRDSRHSSPSQLVPPRVIPALIPVAVPAESTGGSATSGSHQSNGAELEQMQVPVTPPNVATEVFDWRCLTRCWHEGLMGVPVCTWKM